MRTKVSLSVNHSPVLIPAAHRVCTLIFPSSTEKCHTEHEPWRKCFPGPWQVEECLHKVGFGKILQVSSEGVEPGDLSAVTGLVAGPWWLNSRRGRHVSEVLA